MIRPLVTILIVCFSQNLTALNYGSLPFVITDSRHKQPIVGGSVCIEPGNKCVISGTNGVGVIDSVEPGLYSVTVTVSGYDTLSEPNVLIKSGVNNTLNLNVNQSMKNLEKILVTGHKLMAKAPSQSTSITRITTYELSNTSGTINDLNRVLGSHPSVVSGGTDFDNTIYVRGGHSCENIFLVDGIEFENTSHFSGLEQSGGSIGFINSTLIRDLEFYTGGFPAGMPPRISSVIKVNLRNGSMNNLKTQVDLNMSGLGLVLESPLPNAKGSWIANVRFNDLRFLKPFITLDGVPRFGDGFLKLTLLPSEYSTIMATAVTSQDTYIEEEDLYDYAVPTTYKEKMQQYGGIMAWNYNKKDFQNSLSISGTRADRSGFDDALHFDKRIQIDSASVNMSVYRKNNTIVDTLVLTTDTMLHYKASFAKKRFNGAIDKRWLFSIKDDVVLSIGDLHRIGAGFNANYRRYNILNESSFEMQQTLMTYYDGIDTILNTNQNAWISDSILDIASGGGYAEYVFETGPVKTIVGIRSDYYDVITDYGISPRLGLCFDGSSLGNFSLSAGLYHQFPADFSGLIGTLIANNPNMKFTGGVPLEEVRLQRNWQAVLGYERTIGKDHLLSFETYCKWYDHEYPYVSPQERQYYTYNFNDTKQDYDFRWKLSDPKGKKRSYGIELMFKKNQHKNLYYSGALSIFNIENKYTDGKWYHDEMDVGQTLNLSVGTNFSKHHGFALRAQVSNGRRYTPIVYNQLNRNYELNKTKKYYSEQLPVNACVNFRYTFKSFLPWGNITGYIDVLNMLNLKPVVERIFDPYSKDGFSDFIGNGILPIAGITVDF